MKITGLPTPDYDFSPVLLDKQMAHLCPLPRLRVADGYDQPGCYAWYNSDTGEVMYIGKALRMRNRLQQHWYSDGSDIMERMIEQDDILPAVAVWLCAADQRVTMERRLLDMGMPPYNKRKD